MVLKYICIFSLVHIPVESWFFGMLGCQSRCTAYTNFNPRPPPPIQYPQPPFLKTRMPCHYSIQWRLRIRFLLSSPTPSYVTTPYPTPPPPKCFQNHHGYKCCNEMLDKFLDEKVQEMDRQNVGCNLQRNANQIQMEAQQLFNHSMETIVSSSNIENRSHYRGELYCKRRTQNGKVVLLYATAVPYSLNTSENRPMTEEELQNANYPPDYSMTHIAMNIWDLAKNKFNENKEKALELEQKLDDESGNQSYMSEIRKRHESHILVCGNRKSGKSSFQMDFFERKEEIKESVGLEYLYARRTRGNVKDIANLWELGGGYSVANLMSVPINAKTIEVASAIILLDLTKLEEFWLTAEKLMESLKRIIDNLCKNDVNLQNRLKDKQAIRLEKYEEADMKIAQPCLIPITIVGSKYDEFQNFESEKRRSVCQFLRFIAHYYGANLMMYSSRMEQFAKLVKNMTSHFAFGTVCPQGYMIDHNKPLFVKCGHDSFEAIGAPPSSESFMRALTPYEMWKDSFSAVYPQKEGGIDRDDSAKSDPVSDPLFKEPAIDNLLVIKRKELENLIRQKRDREAAEARAAEKISRINLR
ncbi:unnamed protein product [Caenorhabditis bovis]|uniref:Cytoplasmic dynein 2 light intermediate chain 1 n=1 Tax=Caenorhabditis bovis TaxID=2654633 RepID=A0A8S1E8A3_9PELO|nr:unnamed protein product [Caenorhabditis bovis]